MAIQLKYASFNTPREVAEFAASPANGVTAIVSLTFDSASGKWVVFYT